MKKQTFSYRNAPKLSQVVKQLQGLNGYIKFDRDATSGSGDIVHVIKNPNGEFMIEFCVKIHPTLGHPYVNWARVSGTEENVAKFCKAVQFEQLQSSTTRIFTSKL